MRAGQGIQAGVRTDDNTTALASCSSETPGKIELETQTKYPQSSLSKWEKGSGPMKSSIDMKFLGAVLECTSPPRLML